MHFSRCHSLLLIVLQSRALLVFINYLCDVLSAHVLSFADDVKLIPARSRYEERHKNLQAAIQWCEDCDLPLDAAKRSHIFNDGPPTIQLSLVDGTVIFSLDFIRDLVVTVTPTFEASLPCQQEVNRDRVSCSRFALSLRS